jgi:hypothetical protein
MCYILQSRWLSAVTASSQPPLLRAFVVPCRPVEGAFPVTKLSIVRASPFGPMLCARVGRCRMKSAAGVDPIWRRLTKTGEARSSTRLEVPDLKHEETLRPGAAD